MKKVKCILFILTFVLLMGIITYANSTEDYLEENQEGFIITSTEYYTEENYKVFNGYSDPWGWKAFGIDTSYTIKVQTHGTDKGITKHSVSASMSPKYPGDIGNGTYRLLSSIVYEGSKEINRHYGSSFTQYTIIIDPQTIAYLHHEKATSDVMSTSSAGKVIAGFQFSHSSFYPVGSWNNEINVSF